MDKQQTRRRSARVSISSTVICESADLAKFVGEACNLSIGGIALKTNYPLRIREQFAAELLVPNDDSPIRVEGKVVWRRFHGDSLGQEDTLCVVGIRFLNLTEPSRTVIRKYVESSSSSPVT
jgi:hypothetical protein